MTELVASEVVRRLADLASQGTYKNVTPAGARNMNKVFDDTAALINFLESIEDDDAEKNEQQAQAEAAQLLDDELAEIEGDKK